ncbi:MAG: sensor histidine kinase [Gemmatimonadales bacterium]
MTPGELWWIVLASVGVTAVLGGAFVLAVVAAHRRLLANAREFARRLLEAQEEERAWVARELHDDVVQRMFLLRGRLEGMAGALEDLDALTEQLRGVARRMHPSALDLFGLEGGLKALADDLRERERFEVRLEGDVPRLPAAPALAVFRIVQEALRNVQRHAGVSAATVRLRSEGGSLRVDVADRGRGLARGDGAKPGLGLSSMRERARLVGGTLELSSPPDGGAVVTLRVPLPAEVRP